MNKRSRIEGEVFYKKTSSKESQIMFFTAGSDQLFMQFYVNLPVKLLENLSKKLYKLSGRSDVVAQRAGNVKKRLFSFNNDSLSGEA